MRIERQRALVERFARHLADGTTDTTVLFELELTGLAKLGKISESPLDQGRFIFD